MCVIRYVLRELVSFLFSSDGASEWLSKMVRTGRVSEETGSPEAESAHSLYLPISRWSKASEGRGGDGGNTGLKSRGWCWEEMEDGTGWTCGRSITPNFYHSYLAAFGVPFILQKKGQSP